MDGNIIEAALAYAVHGWHVFPLHSIGANGRCTCRDPKCESQGKHPRTLHGFKDASSDPNRVQFAFEAYDNPNIGITTGAVSGMFVLDVDPRHGGMKSLNELQERFGVFPETVRVLTGSGGDHYYFSHPGRPFTNKAAALGLSGIDIRGDGGYVAAPPSLHESGKNYEWMLGCDWRADLAEAPLALVAAIERYSPRPSSYLSGDGKAIRISEGQRNDALFRLGCSMRRNGFGMQAICNALVGHNEEACDPPLGEAEVREIARSAARYNPGALPPTPQGATATPPEDHPVTSEAPPAETKHTETEPEHPHRPRRPAIDILTDYLLDTVEIRWRNKDKGYSVRDAIWYTQTSWKRSYDPVILDLLLAEAAEFSLGDLDKAKTVRARQELALKAWNIWATPALRDALRSVKEQSVVGETTADEEALLAQAVRNALTKNLRISRPDSWGTHETSSVLRWAIRDAGLAWKQIGNYGVWCKAGPRIALAPDFLFAQGGNELKKFGRKVLARKLRENGIARSEPVVASTRLYVIDDVWLADNFELTIEDEQNVPAPAEHDVKKLAAGDTEDKDDVPF